MQLKAMGKLPEWQGYTNTANASLSHESEAVRHSDRMETITQIPTCGHFAYA